jgi:hypothetical protein
MGVLAGLLLILLAALVLFVATYVGLLDGQFL